jgi:hypothetical protein
VARSLTAAPSRVGWVHTPLVCALVWVNTVNRHVPLATCHSRLALWV